MKVERIVQSGLDAMTELYYAGRIEARPRFKDGTVYGIAAAPDPIPSNPGGPVACGRHWHRRFQEEEPIEAIQACTDSLDRELEEGGNGYRVLWRQEPTISFDHNSRTWSICWRLTWLVPPDHPFAVAARAVQNEPPQEHPGTCASEPWPENAP